VGLALGSLRRADAVRNKVRIQDAIAFCFGRTLHATVRKHEPRCRCVSPNHVPDRNPSLRVHAAKQVCYCDACGWGGDVFAVIRAWRRCSFVDAVRWLDEHADDIPPTRIRSSAVQGTPREHAASVVRGPSAVYAYFDADWTLLYEKVRTPDKRFFYRRPTNAGGWVWGLGSVRPVLYRLPSLTGLPFVLVVEGEKDVDAAWEHELPATTNPEGAGNGKWKLRYTKQLRATGVRRVYVVPDNDAVGRLHAGLVVSSCRAAGLRAWRVTLPGVPAHGDLSDYFAQGHSRRDVFALMRRAKAAR
jgi:DNA primase